MCVQSLCLLFGAQRRDWIHVHGATRRKKTGEERGHREQQTRTDQRERIAWTYFIQNLREHTSRTQRKQKSDADGKRRLHRALTHNERENILTMRAERHANADLTGATCDGVRFHTVDADDRKKKRDRKSTRLNSSHVEISYAVFCLKKKKTI